MTFAKEMTDFSLKFFLWFTYRLVGQIETAVPCITEKETAVSQTLKPIASFNHPN
jgi:hypothetical protein